MLLCFSGMEEITIPHLNGGEGEVCARMFADACNKAMVSRLPSGSSIGTHQHTDSSEWNYVLSGTGEAICDGVPEELAAGCCQYCAKGSSHSICNTGSEDLVLFTVVAEQE